MLITTMQKTTKENPVEFRDDTFAKKKDADNL